MTEERRVFDEIAALLTEQRNPRTMDLDRLGTGDLVERLAAEDRLVPDAVAAELPWIAQAVDLVVEAFRKGGRLIYVGAGTSGRLGVLDAAECPDLRPPDMVRESSPACRRSRAIGRRTGGGCPGRAGGPERGPRQRGQASRPAQHFARAGVAEPARRGAARSSSHEPTQHAGHED